MKVIILTLSILFLSCSSYKINNYYDEFEKFEWFRYENNLIQENYIGIDVEINPQIWTKGKIKIYSLQVKLVGKEKLNIEEGFSLIISANGEIINLGNDTNKSFRKRVSKNIYYEEAWFEVDDEVIYKLAFAENCKFKINGKTQFIKGYFSKFNHNTFKDFYKNHIDASIWEIPTLKKEITKNTFSIKSKILKKPETTLNKFSQILFSNGWEGYLEEIKLNNKLDNIESIEKLNINFELPVRVNQYIYPKFNILRIIFKERNKIPNVTKNNIQIYPCAKCLNTFPLGKFKFLFPNMPASEIKDLENWAAYRKENDVYLIIGEEFKQDNNEIFGYIIEYFNSETNTDIDILEDRLNKNYTNKKELFEAGKMVQIFLKENNFYLGEIDGLFGKKSIISLQKFLKEKEFYDGKIDGIKNIKLENAIKNYQNFLNVKRTGWINIQTAKKMIK